MLTAKGTNVFDENGNLVFWICQTPRLKELINNAGYDPKVEFWHDYRKRTEPERVAEIEKMEALAKELVELYNQKHG